MSANAEIIAELRRVLNERDQAREQLDLTKRELGRWVDREAKAVRERDEARAKCDSLSKQVSTLSRNCTTHYDHGLQLRRWLDETIDQRDEARAEVGRLREMAHDFEAMREDRDEARAERDAAIARITEVGVMVATNGNLLAKDAYRRGAEAMREACAQWFREHDESFELTVDACHDVIADMPIPEEP